MKLTPKTPWHLWIVGVLALAWNSYGAWDYIQTKLENREYLSAISEPMGIEVDAVIAYYNSYPLWANITWGFGVWGSVLGSVLLLVRSRYAAHAFLVSLVSFVLSMVHQFTNPMEGVGDMTIAYIFSAVIFAIIFGLWYYARRMTAKNVLK